MKFIIKILLVISSFFLIACSDKNSHDQKLVLGNEIYNSLCKSCHLNGEKGPNLYLVKLETSSFIYSVTNGVGNMPSFKTLLSEEEIEAVAYFILEN
jgi:mono/diheme cytochrome c family protein